MLPCHCRPAAACARRFGVRLLCAAKLLGLSACVATHLQPECRSLGCAVPSLGALRSDRSCYLMELAAEPERELFLDVDAALAGSEARMINDFTGLAAEPNVVAKVCHCPSTGDLRIAVLTTRRIEAGGELLLDYGVGFLADWKVDAMADDGCSSNDDGCCGSDDE